MRHVRKREFRKEGEVWADKVQEAVNDTKKEDQNLQGVEERMPTTKPRT